ncbi:Replicative DNA helicase [bioreactor metagenome]|uniref:Replicative DNA helicase n=1 Tax=bioreactor metagenome TaxID=1076179 RepID=A0A645DK05_9ZZZZ
MLSDLRESGSIEQDADIVLMLHRPDYYADGAEDAVDEDSDRRADQTDLIVAKNRHGPTDDIQLIFNKDYTLFTSMEKIRNDM